MLLCPKCLKKLTKVNNMYKCEDNHCYDIAKEGYVNLMLANQKHSINPGDDKESLNSRNDFLNNGYYKPLADKLAELIGKYFYDEDVFLDAGCGTGYYLNQVMSNVDKKINYYATDISKKGVSMTSKKCKSATCFVGNVFHLPFEDEALDGLMSVFCPYSSEEFSRVIKKGGYVISVTPGKQHLYQLKEIVYDNPYYNDEQGYKLDDFDLVERTNVTYMMKLTSNKDICSLWMMMPYYHTTSKSDNDKLLTRDQADSLADFLVCVYKKR